MTTNVIFFSEIYCCTIFNGPSYLAPIKKNNPDSIAENLQKRASIQKVDD